MQNVVVTRVCVCLSVCVCVSVCGRMPTLGRQFNAGGVELAPLNGLTYYRTDPDVTWGNGGGVP